MTSKDFRIPLTDELAQEVAGIQAQYEAYRDTLPPHLRSFIVKVPKTSTLMSPGRLSVLALPFWVGEAFGVDLESCRKIALANLFGLLHFVIQDHLSDGNCPLTEIPSFAISGTLLQQQMYNHYLQCFPSPTSFWQLMSKYWQEWADSIAWERQVGAFSTPEDGDLLRAARKAAPLKICTSGMAILGNCETQIPDLEKAIDMMHMVMQMADDMSDITEDIAGNRFNTLLNTMISIGAFDPQSGQDMSQLGRIIFVNNVDKIHIQRMWTVAETARELFTRMGLEQCAELIDQTVRFAEQWRDHQLREIIAEDLDKLLERKGQKQKEKAQKANGSEEIETKITDLASMRKHFADYSPVTAREIVNSIPKAYELYCNEGGRWGPGIIARCTHVTSTTVGRYLKAFKENGVNEIDHIPLP